MNSGTGVAIKGAPLPHREKGFVLVSSLVLLSLMTMLSFGNLNKVSMEERAAANLRDRNETLTAADAALRHGENILARELTYPFPSDHPDIWSSGGPISSEAAIKEYLDHGTWSASRTADLRSRIYGASIAGTPSLPGRDNDPLPPPRYFIEDSRFEPDDLSTTGRGLRLGDSLYRVTARATGSADSTSPTVQSNYRKRYN